MSRRQGTKRVFLALVTLRNGFLDGLALRVGGPIPGSVAGTRMACGIYRLIPAGGVVFSA